LNGVPVARPNRGRVDNHLHHAYEKLGVEGREQLRGILG
jgi:DNA-binding CsgD family transcriptional regulator